MTVGELLLIMVAFFVLAGGGLWLYAWWKVQHDAKNEPKNEKWP